MKRPGLCMSVAGVLIMVGGYLLLTHTPAGMFTIVFKQNPGRFGRKAMEAIVEQVRLTNLKPGERREFMLSNVSDPNFTRAIISDQVLPRGYGGGHVWAEMSSDGKLKVVIETRDLGHAGEYGFAYSDVRLSPRPFDRRADWFEIDVPGHLTLVKPSMKIDDHWWEVVYNLD